MRTRPSNSTGEDGPPANSDSAADAAKQSLPNGGKIISDVLTRQSNTTSGLSMVERRMRSTASPKASQQPQTWAKTSQRSEKEAADLALLAEDLHNGPTKELETRRRARMRNPLATSWRTLVAVVAACLLLAAMLRSFLTRQLDPKGCRMSYMRSSFVRYTDFDTEHTRFATKYNLYLYREIGIDDDARVKGVPVLFIPGNAGSYKQVRSLASEAAFYYQNSIAPLEEEHRSSKRPLDFFTVDFNEDITAFHGQTLLDQAEYLNDAIAYILSLYHTSHRSNRDPSLPDPSSVVLVGHSMGGVVARTMLTMPNYQANTINTIVTLAAPHARAPVSFDAQIVDTYKRINDYWRDSYSKRWSNENPLWHVTLVSIAGGGLDTIVPSDYASVASIVPETHGFTVFTSTMPNVWTGMDHLAITWCDQLRKSVVRALYDVVDVNHATQVRRRADRMRSFKKRFLSGLEDIAERSVQQQESNTLLTLEEDGNVVLSQGERLVVRSFGNHDKPKAYLMPLPPPGSADGRRFTMLTDQSQDIDLLFCSVYSHQDGQSSAILSMNGDVSASSAGRTRLVCKTAMDDMITLPASRSGSTWPFDEVAPFSYFQYDVSTLADHHFVALIDKSNQPRPGFAVAEFSSTAESAIRPQLDLPQLLVSGLSLRLPTARPLTVDVKLPALHSSLFAYKLRVTGGKDNALFAPLVRQYTSEVYESRFFVDPEEVDVNLHGVAPYMPPSFRSKSPANGLAFQLWIDPTSQGPVEFSLQMDVTGSLGKLWMRYRTFFGALPLLVVALALRKQIQVYDRTGVFMSFAEGLNQSLTRSVFGTVLALVCIAATLGKVSQGGLWAPVTSTVRTGNATETLVNYAQNDLLLGTPDGFFWFLLPAFTLICFGLCVIVNWAALAITYVFAFLYGRLRSAPPSTADAIARSPTAFAVTSSRQRIITTSVLLALVSTVIPYQFAYLVLCLVQLSTVTRAWRLAMDTDSEANHNFYNYAHSILILMLWILPINMPVLVVWIRNLAVHWLTPFSSHHNILSIMPYILLVETLTTGRLLPRITSW